MVLIILITIIVGVMIYYNINSMDELDAQNEIESIAATHAVQTVTLSYPVASRSYCSGTYYNHTDTTWHALTSSLYVVNGDTVTVNASQATGGRDGTNISQVNLTYYSLAGVEMTSVNGIAGSVWTLAPIIAIVIIAGIILAVVTGFGRKPI